MELNALYLSIIASSMSGRTIDASDSITNVGVSKLNFPQLIFSFGGAPEYPPYDGLDSDI
jgi:hypothetical protein